MFDFFTTAWKSSSERGGARGASAASAEEAEAEAEAEAAAEPGKAQASAAPAEAEAEAEEEAMAEPGKVQASAAPAEPPNAAHSSIASLLTSSAKALPHSVHSHCNLSGPRRARAKLSGPSLS
jgi:nucleoid-associated protein YgaU